MKNNCKKGVVFIDIHRNTLKILMIMKLTTFFLLISILSVTARGYSQYARLDLSLHNASIQEFFQEIEKQSEFSFFFKDDQIDVNEVVSIETDNSLIGEVLNKVFENTDVSYTVVDKVIVITPKKKLQNIQVTGTIRSVSTAETLPGVNILVKGTETGTITGMDGTYSIEAPDANSVLVFSYVGYITQEININGRYVVDVNLEESLAALDEVIVIGYGTQKKVNLTGSVSVIDNKTLENRSAARLEETMQGQVPGLKIVQTDGQPGDEKLDMQIRGRSTFTSNPILMIVDGVPSSISHINPNDIESISILKDASSTAIYGARAAGGVILITTKKGIMGKPQISYDSYVGIQQATALPEKLNSFEHATLHREGQFNDNPDRDSYEFSEEDLLRFSSPDWEGYDRYAAVFSKAIQTQHNISISGGSDNQDYFLSMGYLYQDGILNNTGYKKYNFRYNQNFQLGEKFKLGFKGSFIPDERIAPSEANYPGGLPRGEGRYLSFMYRWPETEPFKTSNEDWAVVQGISPSQVGINSKEGGQQVLKRKRTSGNFNLDYFITDDLKISGQYGINWLQNRQSDYSTRMKFYDPDDPSVVAMEADPNVLLVSNSSAIYQQVQFLINYEKIVENHNISAVAGYTQEWSYQDNDVTGRTDFLTDDIYAISAGSTDPQDWTTAGTMSDWALASLISRVNYSYKNKYLAQAAMRYDGSSRFLSDVRWGFFPSFSAGWRITEEDFLKDNNFLTYLKLRGSWGKVGNQNVGNYPFASTLSTSNYYFNGLPQQTVYIDLSANPSLTWESKTGINIGFDANIKNNLLSFAFDVFKERTTDILLAVPVPTTFGRNAPVQNAGVVENMGWELEVAHRNSFSDFSYGISFNISDATNTVIDLKGTGPWIDGNTITEEGYSMYEWYGWQVEGYFQSDEEVTNHSYQNPATSPGDIKYQENGGDPTTITPEDRVRLGRSDPRFPYGIRIDLQYKNFDLTAFGQGVVAHKVWSNGWTAYNFSGATTTLFKYHLDRWTPETPDARFPKTRMIGNSAINAQFSSFWLENAAYFRLKNLQVGYNIPRNVLSKIKMNRVRIYFSAENLFTITKLLGFDPEIPTGTSARLVENRYPLTKKYYIGLNINF